MLLLPCVAYGQQRSKTIELQIEKSQVLIEGLNRNIAELRPKGVKDESLTSMTNDLSTLKKMSDECDALRENLAGKVKEMNAVLMHVKDAFANHKRIVKTNYPQERWINYGVQDKR